MVCWINSGHREYSHDLHEKKKRCYNRVTQAGRSIGVGRALHSSGEPQSIVTLHGNHSASTIEADAEPVVSQQPRINVWRLGKNVLLCLVLPVVVAIVLDVCFGSWPIITLIVAGLAFPIAGIVVVRSTMQELERVIRELTPNEPGETTALPLDSSRSSRKIDGNALKTTDA